MRSARGVVFAWLISVAALAAPPPSAPSKPPVWTINGAPVTKQAFEALRKALREVPGTWFCKKKTDGGSTGFEAVDEKGTRYRVVDDVRGGLTESSISRLAPAAP